MGYLEASLDRAAASNPDAGRVPPHRMNRTEYVNAIRDLLGLEVDARSLLAVDDSDRGFDNIAGVLSVSPVLLDQYLNAALVISRAAVGDPGAPPGSASQTYSISKGLYQDERAGEDLPFGSRGGLSVRHHFPLDGEYVCKIRLRRTMYGYIRAFDEPSDLELRVDGALVVRLRVGGAQRGPAPPATFAGNITGDPEWEDYMLRGDSALDVRVPIRAGTRTVSVSFVRRTWEPEGILQPDLPPFGYAVNEAVSSPRGNSGPAVDSLAVLGPEGASGTGDTPSRRRIFICRPASAQQENGCARRILMNLATQAFRRPATPDDEQTLMAFYRAGASRAGFEAGVRAGLERLLADPEFVFRIERDQAGPGRSHRLTDLELASRLSFFLWSSLPDQELRNLAATGRLRTPGTLDAQVRRMLADVRSDTLVDSFAAQWFSLRQLRSVLPDPDSFPDFDENLRDALEQETRLFIRSQLRDDHSVADLLTANYTFVNERLARHYGIPNVYGSHFRRVTLDAEARHGLLGHGSLLTVTAYPNRTSPVLRGRWLLENVLGTPPPPPPANVPALKEQGENGRPASIRERMEQHRRNPVCASCHVRMDPLGFALENFDATGRWRVTGDGGTRIDANASFPDGTTFNGVEGLRAFLVSRREDLVRTAIEKMLTYALGRGLEPYDMPTVRAITRDVAARNDRWSAIVLAVVKSVPFQMRRSE